ncbi:hypothetical protein L208DRAFT_1322218, partial [Tricholoma matsutake]
FQNCLVSMRPNTNKADLLTAHDISLYIHNTFVNHLQELKEEIQVIHQTHLMKLD